jgi:hypothetical protein
MATYFDPGRYLVRIEHQRFLESQRRGTLEFCLTFRVQKNLDKPDTRVKSFLRNTTWWITENTVKRVMRDLRTLGYSGDSLAGLDPDYQDFYDFSGQEIELICTHESNEKGDVFERWSLAATAKPNLENKSKLREFDRLLAKSRGHANGSAADDNAVDAGESSLHTSKA